MILRQLRSIWYMRGYGFDPDFFGVTVIYPSVVDRSLRECYIMYIKHLYEE